SKITLAATIVTLLGTLAIAALATTITAANTNNRRAESLLQARAVRPVGGTPQYQIFDIGVVDVGDSFSQGFGVSLAGVAVGRSVRNDGSHAVTRTQNGGIVSLPDLAGRSFCVSNSANDSGVVVGTGASTVFGSGRLPVIDRKSTRLNSSH